RFSRDWSSDVCSSDLQLGGHAVLLSQNYIGWGVRETIRDVASNLDRWVDGIMARTYGHDTLVTLAHHAKVPVINGLSDRLHPCRSAERRGREDSSCRM